jgi:hypothetical protein
MLDRKTHPEWHGSRTKMVYAFPTAEKLWDEYRLLRSEGMANGDAGRGATEYYRANQAAMDAGSIVAWPERFSHDELSAIQHAMNLKITRGDEAFAAEYQNEPLSDEGTESQPLQVEALLRRCNRIPAGIIPSQASELTAGIGLFVDAKDEVAASFYAKFGFQAVPGRPLKLFLPMDTVREFAAAESRKR